MAFNPTQIGAQFRYRDAAVSFGVLNNIELAKYDPYRVALFFSTSTASVQCRPNAFASAAIGFNIPSTLAPLVFKLNEVGPLVQQQWFGFVGAPPATVYVLEVLWQPPGE